MVNYFNSDGDFIQQFNTQEANIKWLIFNNIVNFDCFYSYFSIEYSSKHYRYDSK